MTRLNKTYLVINLLYLAVVASMVVQSLTFAGEAGIVPLVVGLPTLLMILISISRHLFLSVLERGGAPAGSAGAAPVDVASWPRGAVIIGWVGVFFLLIFLIGFYLSIPLYTLVFLRAEGKLPWARAAITAAILWGVVYVSFDMLMGQALFEGVVFHALLPSL